MAVNIQSAKLNAQTFRWSLNTAIFKIAAAATIDQELTKCWAVLWELSSYYVIVSVSWMEKSLAVLLHVKGNILLRDTHFIKPESLTHQAMSRKETHFQRKASRPTTSRACLLSHDTLELRNAIQDEISHRLLGSMSPPL